MLQTTDYKDIILDDDYSGAIINGINSVLRKLIENDKSLTIGNGLAPTIWEQSWINDSSVQGYSKGSAVWLNTESLAQFTSDNMSQISGYVTNNSILNSEYKKIDKKSVSQKLQFFQKVVTGDASPYVSALFYLGNITDSVQIMVSTKDNNKDLPVSSETSSWVTFYKQNDEQTNERLMYDELSSIMSSAIEQHLRDYHVSGLTNGMLQKFVLRDPQSDIESVRKQYFYDHQYCSEMDGFDYVTEYHSDDDGTYRIWYSGYLEQWGFASNDGSQLIEVHFAKQYDYPTGNLFYQEGFDKYEDTHDIFGELKPGSRYVVSVTPVVKGGTTPYSNGYHNVKDVVYFLNTDVTNLKNSGFSIVNSDVDRGYISGYYYHVSGYTASHDEGQDANG